MVANCDLLVKVAANCNHLSPICSFNKNGAEKEFGNMKWQTYGFIQKPHVEKLTTLMEYLDNL